MDAPLDSTVRPLVLVVDDDATFRERLSRALRERYFEVMAAGDCEEALALARRQSPELCVADLRMPGRSGLELVKALKALDPATHIVVLTGYGSIATALEAVRLGAAHYLTKPADADEVVAAFGRGDGQAATAAPEREPTAPSLARAEWEHIQRVLTDCGGNISETARRLRIHRRSLQRKLEKPPSTSE